MIKILLYKFVVSFIVLLAIVLIVTPSHAIPIVSIQPPISTPLIGTNFSVDVAISGVTDLLGWKFGLMFDPTIINAVDIVEGPFLQSGGSTSFIKGTINNTSGKIWTSFARLLSIPGVTGSGILASIELKALSGGISPLTLTDVDLVGLVESKAISIDFSQRNGSANPNPVPEPASILLLGAGLIGLAGLYRKKFKKN